MGSQIQREKPVQTTNDKFYSMNTSNIYTISTLQVLSTVCVNSSYANVTLLEHSRFCFEGGCEVKIQINKADNMNVGELIIKFVFFCFIYISAFLNKTLFLLFLEYNLHKFNFHDVE